MATPAPTSVGSGKTIKMSPRSESTIWPEEWPSGPALFMTKKPSPQIRFMVSARFVAMPGRCLQPAWSAPSEPQVSRITSIPRLVFVSPRIGLSSGLEPPRHQTTQRLMRLQSLRRQPPSQRNRLLAANWMRPYTNWDSINNWEVGSKKQEIRFYEVRLFESCKSYFVLRQSLCPHSHVPLGLPSLKAIDPLCRSGLTVMVPKPTMGFPCGALSIIPILG